MKKLDTGTSDFKKFITKGNYFVDKTNLIAYLIEHPDEVHLITRPRRFGKTLNMSMLRYFFEAPKPWFTNGDPPHRDLFNAFSITRHPQCSQYMGKFPVIYLSFKDAKGNCYDDCVYGIKQTIINEYERHAWLLGIDCLDEKLKVEIKLLLECIRTNISGNVNQQLANSDEFKLFVRENFSSLVSNFITFSSNDDYRESELEWLI